MSKTSKAELKKELRKLGIKIVTALKRVVANDGDLEIPVSGKASYLRSYEEIIPEGYWDTDAKPQHGSLGGSKIRDFKTLSFLVDEMLGTYGDSGEWVHAAGSKVELL